MLRILLKMIVIKLIIIRPIFKTRVFVVLKVFILDVGAASGLYGPRRLRRLIVPYVSRGAARLRLFVRIGECIARTDFDDFSILTISLWFFFINR